MRDCYDIIIPIDAIGGGSLNYVSLAAIYINDDYKTAEKIVFYYNSLLIVSDDKYRINYCEIKEIKKNKSDIKIVLNNETIIKIIPSDKSRLNIIYERIGEFKDNIIKIPKKFLYGVINEYYLCFTKDNNNVLIFYNLIKNIMIDKDTLYIEYFYNEELNENKNFSIKVNDEEEKAKFLDLIDYIHSFKQMKENVPYVEFINYRYREESDHEFGKKLVVEKDHIHVFEYDFYGQDYSEHDSYKIKFTEIKKFSVLSFTKDEVVFSIEVNKEQYEEKENKEVKTDFSHLYYMNPVIIWVEKLDQFFNGESIPTMLSDSEEKVIKKSSPTKLKSAIQVGIFVTLIVGIIIPTIFVGKLNFRLIVISFFIPFLIIMLKKNTNNMEYKKIQMKTIVYL